MKDLEVLEQLRKEKVPHIIIFEKGGFGSVEWCDSVAVCIPRMFRPDMEFIRGMSLDNKVAEKELSDLTIHQLPDNYKRKMSNDNGSVYEWVDMNFKYYSSLLSATRITERFKHQQKYINYLADNRKIKFELINNVRYFCPVYFEEESVHINKEVNKLREIEERNFRLEF
jgi:hypothetical protein